MDVFPKLSDFLRMEIPNILNLWETRVREEITASRYLGPTDLKDSLPEFLENLARVLESNEKDQLTVQYARKHGKERSNSPQYTLDQIIGEYRLLRRAVFDVIGKGASDQERDSIIDSIEIGISEAASEFTRQQYQLREQFITTIAHDLRSPLTAAKVNAQLILRGPENLKLALEKAAHIVDTIDRADRMIKDLLDSNRVQMGQKLLLQIEQSDLRVLTQLTLDEVASVYGNRFVLEADSAVIGYWDPSIIQRAIGNLLENAIKYGDPKSPVKVKITQKEDEIEFSVHNEGIPIPAQEQEYIFDNFYRGKNSPKKGWGIGLYLVKAAAIAHSGSVRLLSQENEGTTFSIVLPRDCRPECIEK